jgi:hypothetical protein
MPSHLFHALVWIDHQVARVFHFNRDTNETAIVRSSHPHQHLHHKANSGDSGHAPMDKEFFRRVVAEVSSAGAILIVGPSSAKIELRTYIADHHPQVAAKISAVETLDHPTDGELLAFGRKFFRADDRMHLQVPARTG